MIRYAIKSDTGDFLKRDKTTYCETADMSSATMWDSAAKAKNIINNSIKLPDRSKYQVVQVVQVLQEDGSTKEATPTTGKTINDSFDRVINQYQMFVDECDRRMQHLSDMLGKVDRELVDITHFIEFYSLNASAGYKAYRLMHDKRIERRAIKNEIEAIVDIKKHHMGDFDTIKSLMSRDKSKKYKPREMPELFKRV